MGETDVVERRTRRKVLKAGSDVSELIVREVVILDRTSEMPQAMLTCLITKVDTVRINYLARLRDDRIAQGFLMHNNYKLDLTPYKPTLFSRNTGDLTQDAIYDTLDKLLTEAGVEDGN